eukprot:636543-Rhodomonas_salina.2
MPHTPDPPAPAEEMEPSSTTPFPLPDSTPNSRQILLLQRLSTAEFFILYREFDPFHEMKRNRLGILWTHDENGPTPIRVVNVKQDLSVNHGGP